MNEVTNINFLPCKPSGSLVGFVSFIYEGKIAIKGAGVHKKLDGSGYRLVYPQGGLDNKSTVHPIKSELTELIDSAITKHIQGVKNERTQTKASN